MDRSYEHAVDILESRRRIARPKIPSDTARNGQQASQAPIVTPDLKGTPSIVGMREWLQSLGHPPEDIDRLNVIHVAGTKGKGSTCAFTEAMLRAHGQRIGYPTKTGLYTSPHLMHPEERIRINSQPLARSDFAKYFFEVYDSLPQLHSDFDPGKPVIERGPRFLQLFALFAFHVFIREKVDATIIETHNGGEYDATNMVEKPLVTAITTLGMDHVEMLGPTLENISWHKAGIYKTGSVALSTTQQPSAAKVLDTRAADRGEKVRFVDIDPRLPTQSVKLKPVVQQKNASLAIAAAEAYLQRVTTGITEKPALTKQDIAHGIELFSWPGRFQNVQEGKQTWYLDSAHNEMSVAVASEWFAEATRSQQAAAKILIFSHINELRDSAVLLSQLARALYQAGTGITHVIFSTYDETASTNKADTSQDKNMFENVWREVYRTTEIIKEPSIQGAMERARQISNGYSAADILVTGSQHLVGPALRILQSRGVVI